MEQPWNIIHVLPRNEKKVLERLVKQGITAYLPLQKQLRQWSDRKKWVEVVVLSGYVFVKCNPSDQLQMLQTPGVSCFMKHCNKLVEISEKDMLRFQNFIHQVKEAPIEFTSETLPIGTPITIQNGYFKGFSGEVVSHKGKRKLSIKLSNFGYCMVELSTNDVLPQNQN